MSTKSVQQFLIDLESDQALQERLIKALEAENKRQAVTDIAQSKGYNFSADELCAEVEKRWQNEAQAQSGELSENELETVAGGFMDSPSFICHPDPYPPLPKPDPKW